MRKNIQNITIKNCMNKEDYFFWCGLNIYVFSTSFCSCFLSVLQTHPFLLFLRNNIISFISVFFFPTNNGKIQTIDLQVNLEHLFSTYDLRNLLLFYIPLFWLEERKDTKMKEENKWKRERENKKVSKIKRASKRSCPNLLLSK